MEYLSCGRSHSDNQYPCYDCRYIWLENLPEDQLHSLWNQNRCRTIVSFYDHQDYEDTLRAIEARLNRPNAKRHIIDHEFHPTFPVMVDKDHGEVLYSFSDVPYGFFDAARELGYTLRPIDARIFASAFKGSLEEFEIIVALVTERNYHVARNYQ